MSKRNIIAITYLAGTTYFNNFLFSDDETSESESDQDVEERKLHKNKMPIRIRLYCEETIPRLTDQQFRQHFRLNRTTFKVLLEKIAALLKSKRSAGRQTIDDSKQILSVLWLLGTPDSYRSIAERFDLSKSTLWNCFKRVINALNIIAPEIIRWRNLQEIELIKTQFKNMAGINGVVGAIDGTYVPIKAPSNNSEVYINRKCFHAITLQAICVPSLEFTNCFTGYPSSVSDIRIFRNSDIYQEFVNNTDVYFNGDNFIIGDKAYPLNNWCVPPYIDRGNMDDVKINFNKMHAKTRQVIERAFALLFGRFRRLRYLDMSRVDLIPQTIIAACVLHNICLTNVDEPIEDYVQEGHRVINCEDVNENIVERNPPVEHAAGHKRDLLARALYLQRNI